MKAPHQRVIAVIPARLASTRLPGKVLLPIAGVPMLGWVYRAAQACPQLDQVLIATDSTEVAAYAQSQGWPSVMTSSELESGTDRVQAVAARVDADIYVNIQGDEPMIRREHIDALLRPFRLPGAEVTTLSTPCSPEEVDDPNAIPEGYQSEIIWDGLNLLPYSVAPHYRSDHPESAAVDQMVQHLIDNHILFKALRDGQAIVVNGDLEWIAG